MIFAFTQKIKYPWKKKKLLKIKAKLVFYTIIKFTEIFDLFLMLNTIIK